MSKKIYTPDDIRISKPNDHVVGEVDISREGFERNLISASRHALEFARTLVKNILPDEAAYIVYLGASHDGNRLSDGEHVFPEDYGSGKRYFLNAGDIVELLWRAGKVPEWINVTVDSEDGKHTLIRLECCGRYSSDVANIYHAHEGRAPFHVLGPAMPPEFDLSKGEKYDLYWNKS